MPEHIEVETQDLQEKIDEINEERHHQHEEEKRFAWVRYVGLSTAILAVFAAIGALQSGNLVNEALIHQLKASDTWNEYQAARQKEHIYIVALDAVVDSHPSPAMAAQMTAPLAAPAKPSDDKPLPKRRGTTPPTAESKSPVGRAADYRAKIYEETTKEDSLSVEARNLETESAEEIERHHKFEYSVALIQVAIAVGAVAALTRVKAVWYLSMLSGLAGIAFFAFGFM